MKVYISGALTGTSNHNQLKRFYEQLGRLCEQYGLIAYVPHLATDPVNHPHVSPHQVYALDREQVSNSNLVIAYVGQPSSGVGMEVQIAESNHIPVLLLYEQGKSVSRMIRGCPNIIGELHFKDVYDGLVQVAKFLKKLTGRR